MAPVTDRPLVVVSHGSPSDPAEQEIAVQAVAARIQSLRPEGPVHGATLAAKGALERAVRGLQAPIICPWFMSDGWFVSSHLPERLRIAGLKRWDKTAPLGLMPGLPGLIANRLKSALSAQGMCVSETVLVLAAHGSPTAHRPREVTEAMARSLAGHLDLAEIRPCYVDEPPAIREAARVDGPALVLPFFAARAGHVMLDLPEELEAAGFTGPVLDPVGTWPEAASLAMDCLHLETERLDA